MYFQRSEEHTSELQSLRHIVCRLLLEKKDTNIAHRFDTCLVCRSAANTPAITFFRSLRCARPSYPHTWQRTAPLIMSCFFFFNDTATTEIYTFSLHDALPI